MQLFESIFDKISKDERWIQKIIIGVLISFIPILNLLVLGYLYRFGLNIKMQRIVLPEWNEWRKMLVETVRCLSVIVIYALVPVCLGWALSEVLRTMSFNILGFFMYLPLSFVLLVIPGLTMIALYGLSEEPTVESLFSVKRYWRIYGQCWKRLLVPTFVFFGIVIVGLPLFGISFFIAFVGLIAYSFSVLMTISTKEGSSYADI